MNRTDITIPAIATDRQKVAIEDLLNKIEDLDFLSRPESYEFKEIEVTDNTSEYRTRPTLCLVTEVGRKSDEGTLAAVFARTRRQIFIGPDGGISTLVATKRGQKSYRIIKGRKALYRSTDLYR